MTPIHRWLALAGLLSLLLLAPVARAEDEPKHPTDLPDLVSFWDFQEPAGKGFTAQGAHAITLEEMKGPIERVAGATIMGDGRVALILDVRALVRAAAR